MRYSGFAATPRRATTSRGRWSRRRSRPGSQRETRPARQAAISGWSCLRTAAVAVSSGVVVHDARGSVMFANAAARRIFAAAAWLFGNDAGAERARLRKDGTTMPYDE